MREEELLLRDSPGTGIWAREIRFPGSTTSFDYFSTVRVLRVP